MLLKYFISVSAIYLSTAQAGVLYLVNCGGTGTGSSYSIASEMAYYDAAPTNFPTNNPNPLTQVDGGEQPLVDWAGNAISGTFSTGTTATSHINAGANALKTGESAGWASNSYGTSFGCYRDDDTILYSSPESDWQCEKRFYCLS